MTLSTLNTKIGFSVKDYYYGCYDTDKYPFILAEKTYNRQDGVQLYVVKSMPRSGIEGTMFDHGTVRAKELHQIMQELDFYFFVITKDYNLENLLIPDTVFLRIEDAQDDAKKLLSTETLF